MSIKIRWLTNGDKTVYTVRDLLNGTFDVVEDIKEIPEEIRHYAENIEEPTFCEPDLARMFGVTDVFYPDWPKSVIIQNIQKNIVLQNLVDMVAKIKDGKSVNILVEKNGKGYINDFYDD